MSDVLTPADAAEREAALDLRRSVIVQAPAGSGKTDLLTRRFLRLLATVDEPEEILAITFTRAATAEMRVRILNDLAKAAGQKGFRPEDIPRIELARQALAQSERRGWDILNHPQRLAIETIDSLCLRIAHDQPLLARLGGRMQPTEQAKPLYALAARHTIQLLGGSDAALNEALEHLLALRDNSLADCESLIAGMLDVRDEWIHAFPLSGTMSDDDWSGARSVLEAPFSREVRRVLGDAYRLLNSQPAIAEQLLQLADYACSQGNQGVGLLSGIATLSPAMSLDHWRCIASFLLKEDGEWRRSVDKRHGFPAATGDHKRRKEAMLDLLQWLQHVPQLRPTLAAIRELPPTRYSEEQWTTLRHVFTVLRRAVAELRVVFAQRDQVDFTEIAIAARAVLKEHPVRAADLGGNVRHLLIDEFQDTSRRQHELIESLLSAWEPGEKRTVFLVGDPMQSIYMFRQAEVELFHKVRERGIGPDGNCIHCEPLQLTVNFRSHAGLVNPLNSIFDQVFAEPAPPGAAGVPFVRATASANAEPGEWLHILPQIIGSPNAAATPADHREAQVAEARQVLRIVEQQLPLIERARMAGAEYRVAILVRARPHLAEIVPLLRDAHIPFRAVEIEHLADRQEMRDLLSLTRALLHPMDRVAWLSVLRAPWCGLILSDLHRLTGSDDPTAKPLSLLELVDRNASLLSPDGQRRLARTMEILRAALALRWRPSQSPSLSSWIERTWRTLGGPACIDEAADENVQVFFSMLDALPADGLALGFPDFLSEFNRLFAQPDPAVSEACGVQLMTIHKAKGLGFEVVIVPGLDRKPVTDQQPLVCSLERINPFTSETEHLVAPVGLKGEDADPLNQWVSRQRRMRFDEERRRLLYVACTRARRELHLLGTAAVTQKGLAPEHGSSLLATAWPALCTWFENAQQQPSAPPGARILAFPAPGRLDELAASADPAAILVLRRLPLLTEPLPAAPNIPFPAADASVQPGPFRRPHGSRLSRVIGTTVHTLLQHLGNGLAQTPEAQLRAHAAALLRAAALTGDILQTGTATVTQWLLACAADPICQWILAPHPQAQSEASWSGFTASGDPRLRTLRADRVFCAGPEPLTESNDCLWVIDYKTGAPSNGGVEQFLEAERALYKPQLLAYADALRALHGPATPLRVGLYYPAIRQLDFWNPEEV